jgi:plasmid stabilization system protein ParE
MRLRYTADARSHIKAIYDYLAERNPTAALEIVSRIRRAAELLQDFPGIGRAGIDPGTAEWVVRGSPYIIVYEVNMDQDELVILAVFHGSRSRT